MRCLIPHRYLTRILTNLGAALKKLTYVHYMYTACEIGKMRLMWHTTSARGIGVSLARDKLEIRGPKEPLLANHQVVGQK